MDIDIDNGTPKETTEYGGEAKRKQKLTRLDKRSLKIGYRLNPLWVTHGAWALMNAYQAGQISFRTSLGREIKNVQNELVQIRGYERFQDAPITLRMKVQIAVSCWLFLSAYQPSPDVKKAVQEVTGIQNTLNRILTELGLERPDKRIGLNDYIDSLPNAGESDE
jgi:hypothetical protein